MDSFIERFRLLVNERFKNQSAAAEELGVSKGLISGLLSGQHKPSKMVLNLIESRLGVSRQWLLTGEGDINVRPSGIAQEQAGYNDERLGKMIEKMRRIYKEGDFNKLATLQSLLDLADPEEKK